ncbi:DUF2232 domain-containing protein [Bosea caraganae]|uniref:DUF2232 domain-containing protein n=1 Tax=Bosea caraganae TaxID=2763117 RepID=A0A370L4Y7_9HYPH|nr:DUF2232 domain-containing protein [Bosea caraganae]RDJ24154.1 DUF2232 domain-containing protein [Bosea caraganae]RDJ30196.1 DUF2232 domain-containing protein [Bosea caraganae]
MLPIVGIGAGLVSALLFAVVITGSPLAILLYSAAPLPIFIAALGWNHRAGLVATAAGAVAGAVALSLPAGFNFALIVALPAWWIAYLVLLARTDGTTTEWYPLGHLLVWIAATAALTTVGSALVMTTDYEAYRTVIARVVENLLNEMVRSRLIALAPDTKLSDLAQMLAPAVPVGIGASFVTTLVVNLWLAGKAVQLSGRLPRPWPFIPATTVPRRALPLMALALVTIAFGGFVGVAGAAMTGALLAVFMLSGLALIHDLTRGKSWRAPALIAVYVALVVMQALLTPVLTLAGMADSLFGLRKRGPKPPLPPTPNA